MDDLYQETIIDHYKHPRNFGEMARPTHKGRGANASCGDMLELYIQVADGKVVDISFQGIGCALSTAAASILLEKIKVQKSKINDVLAMTDQDVVELMGIPVSPTRMKCVSLPLRSLQSILKQQQRA